MRTGASSSAPAPGSAGAMETAWKTRREKIGAAAGPARCSPRLGGTGGSPRSGSTLGLPRFPRIFPFRQRRAGFRSFLLAGLPPAGSGAFGTGKGFPISVQWCHPCPAPAAFPSLALPLGATNSARVFPQGLGDAPGHARGFPRPCPHATIPKEDPPGALARGGKPQLELRGWPGSTAAGPAAKLALGRPVPPAGSGSR